LGAEGRGFESLRPDHEINHLALPCIGSNCTVANTVAGGCFFDFTCASQAVKNNADFNPGKPPVCRRNQKSHNRSAFERNRSRGGRCASILAASWAATSSWIDRRLGPL